MEEVRSEALPQDEAFPHAAIAEDSGSRSGHTVRSGHCLRCLPPHCPTPNTYHLAPPHFRTSAPSNTQHPSPLITHTWKETPLSEVLHTIAQQSGDYHIHCIYDQLDQLRISAKVANLTIPEAVEKVCKGQPVKVKQRGQDIFVQYRKSMENKKIVLAGRVFDRLTHNQLIGATVILMNRDSAVVAQAIAHSVFQEGERRWEKAEFSMAVPKVEEHYILAVSFVGYETAYMNYTVNNLRKSEIVRNLPDIYLKQESHVLKNVNVVASKVTRQTLRPSVLRPFSAGALCHDEQSERLPKAGRERQLDALQPHEYEPDQLPRVGQYRRPLGE